MHISMHISVPMSTQANDPSPHKLFHEPKRAGVVFFIVRNYSSLLRLKIWALGFVTIGAYYVTKALPDDGGPQIFLKQTFTFMASLDTSVNDSSITDSFYITLLWCSEALILLIETIVDMYVMIRGRTCTSKQVWLCLLPLSNKI